MKLNKILSGLLLLGITSTFVACEEDTTTIGSVIGSGEVDITIETIPYKLNASALEIESFDSKTGNLMLGTIQSDNYGSLDCSFVTRLMCATSLSIPENLFYQEDFVNRIDSCKLIMGAQRDRIVGDSLAPQKLSIFKLTKQLPSASDIDNNFNPSGYYDPQNPFATKSYTVSSIASKDSAFYNNRYVDITVNLPLEFARDVITTYRDKPEVFQWPQNMARDFLPGLYFKNTFGNGCVANINTIYIGIYYYTEVEESKKDENGETITTTKRVPNLIVPFTVSPEVLSSNNITYIPAESLVNKNENSTDGEVVITTPGGFLAQFNFPAEDLLMRYKDKNEHLSTINDLVLKIPAEAYDEDSGLGMAPNLLLIKTSEYESFFAENKIPDNLSSFTGVYDSTSGTYYFSTMRNYFLKLLEKGSLSPEDVEFTLVPVEIETETSGYYTETTYVTKCLPYTSKPTMTLLKSNEAEVVFSFSTQMIK